MNYQSLLTTLLNPEIVNNISENLNNGRPPSSLVDKDNFIYVYVDLPGVVPENIAVNFFNNIITITGSRDKPYETHLLSSIYSFGNFKSTIKLPFSVTNRESVTIRSENGVLIIKINKDVEDRNRFTVNVSSSNEKK
jgi:HSP20 family molecular chaperone IbpA